MKGMTNNDWPFKYIDQCLTSIIFIDDSMEWEWKNRHLIEEMKNEWKRQNNNSIWWNKFHGTNVPGISDIEIDTYKIKKIASNILTVYAYMAVYGYVDVYVVNSNNDIYMHRYSTSLDATDFSAIANVDLICQSPKDGDENKVPIN